MTEPREPRVFEQGSEEPMDDGLRLRDRDGDEWVQLEPMAWSCDGDDDHAVDWDSALSCGPLVEVLPNLTPECTNVLCSRIGGRCVGYHCSVCGEPSSMLGHPKCRESAPDASTEMARSAVASVAGATNPPPATVDAETSGEGGSGDLRAALAAVLDPEVWAAVLDEQSTIGARYQWHERRQASLVFAENAIAAGWRPPLPDWEKELLDDTRREYTENDLAEAYIRGKNSWDLHVEWGCRWPDGTTQRLSTSHEDAVAARLTGTKLGYQMVGPWTEDED